MLPGSLAFSGGLQSQLSLCRSFLSHSAPPPRIALTLSTICIRLDAELTEFNRWITPTKAEVTARKCVIEFFQRIVQTLWWDAEVVECGSITTGLFSTDE